LWSIAKALQIPLDPKIKYLNEMPYTLSSTIRKRQQIDNLNELPKEKRPTEQIIWEGSANDLEEWLEKVMGNKSKEDTEIIIRDIDIEG
jgi:hypothetical protein